MSRGRCWEPSRQATRPRFWTPSPSRSSPDRGTRWPPVQWETRAWRPDAASPLRPELHGSSGELLAEPWPDGVRGRARTARGEAPPDERGPRRALDLPAGLDRALPRCRGPVGERRRQRGAGRVGTDRAHVRERVARLVEARDLHNVTGMRCVDERTVADVHPFVTGHPGRARVEEHQVARLQLVAGHPASLVVLETGVVAEPDPELAIGVHGQPGAIEAARRLTAPDVGNS